MAIHEKSLIREENLKVHEKMTLDGVDVSGHWSTFIQDRIVTDYNEEMAEEIAALPGGEHLHRCWQCGSCTNSCPVHAINVDFNPRFWIYLIQTGMEAELLRDKDIIWQCVSCNKCTYACPRDVFPEGVMKATAHWLELKGHTPKSHSTIFDEVFTEQVVARGKIEDGRTMRWYFSRTGQALLQNWVVAMVMGLLRNLPLGLLSKMGLATFFAPKTSNWAGAREALTEYMEDLESNQRLALGLDELVSMAQQELDSDPAPGNK